MRRNTASVLLRYHRDISWSLEEAAQAGNDDGAESGTGTFQLTWQESGAGLADDGAPQVHGFGTKLLTRVIPTMLRGTAVREFAANGLVYRLEAPLSAIRPGPTLGGQPRHAAEIVDRTFDL